MMFKYRYYKLVTNTSIDLNKCLRVKWYYVPYCLNRYGGLLGLNYEPIIVSLQFRPTDLQKWRAH